MLEINHVFKTKIPFFCRFTRNKNEKNTIGKLYQVCKKYLKIREINVPSAEPFTKLAGPLRVVPFHSFS